MYKICLWFALNKCSSYTDRCVIIKTLISVPSINVHINSDLSYSYTYKATRVFKRADNCQTQVFVLIHTGTCRHCTGTVKQIRSILAPLASYLCCDTWCSLKHGLSDLTHMLLTVTEIPLHGPCLQTDYDWLCGFMHKMATEPVRMCLLTHDATLYIESRDYLPFPKRSWFCVLTRTLKEINWKDITMVFSCQKDSYLKEVMSI